MAPANVPPILSWEEARSSLRALLESYIDDPPPRPSLSPRSPRLPVELPTEENGGDPRPAGSNLHRILWKWLHRMITWWIHHDLDLYLGSITVTAVLVILTSVALSTTSNSSSSRLATDRAQVAAAVLLFLGSVLSGWLARRRRFLCLHDQDYTKRRVVKRFLRAMHRWVQPSPNSTTVSHHGRPVSTERLYPDSAGGEDPGSSSPLRQLEAPASPEEGDLQGTALTAIYPVYRMAGQTPRWSRIPSLLLVKGDVIALQVGDMAPGDCVVLPDEEDPSSSKGPSPVSPPPVLRIQRGERISLTSSWGETTEQLLSSTLPRGRTTLNRRQHADHLLALCNRMRLVRLEETPLEEFISRPSVTPRTSQVARQVEAIRAFLAALGFLFLAVTSICVFSRRGVTEDNWSFVVSLPLLSTLGLLPVVGPAILFFLEVLGTARILTTVHPHARDDEEDHVENFPASRRLMRYVMATTLSRLSLWEVATQIRRWTRRFLLKPLGLPTATKRSKLVSIPPASANLLEKLGVATAFTVVDDELVCEPQAVPQQLLIPSGKGLKLLDLCPAFDDESDDGNASNSTSGRKRGKSFDSDSESEENTHTVSGSLRRKILRRRLLRRPRVNRRIGDADETVESTDSTVEVQFEDPSWWQHLPSLKCIGLAGLLVDERLDNGNLSAPGSVTKVETDGPVIHYLTAAKSSLVNIVCEERHSNQLRLLAQCIGFSTDPNSSGARGDISSFTQRLRLNIVSSTMVKTRLEIDPHERSSEQSRWWGLLRPDSTSVVVQDSRNGAFQLLTVGDPSVVVNLCNEAWQGEISTILPLTPIDRKTILETTENWKLGDLDVAAFSYSPVSLTLEKRLSGDSSGTSHLYLLDNVHQSGPKEKHGSSEWSFLKSQVFLGVLGSLVVPRREVQKLLKTFSDAGVRFVYFSPRNMRRQKELASQMGIDVAWNCAISLRPLECGEEDQYRMVTDFADWDVNAKLPHGVDAVRKHLEEVDNVPLLVSLYTDVTKQTTMEMVEIFQDYHDTVIAVGLSHLPRNDSIFAAADIAVGIDIMTETVNDETGKGDCILESRVLPFESEFVSSMSGHSCAFRFRGASSISHIADIIGQGRASLEASVAGAVFGVTACVSFALYVLFCACTPSTTLPFVPILGAVAYLQVVLPILGLALAMTEGSADIMSRVPPKNDQTVTFGRREGWRLYLMIVVKALVPAIMPQVLHMIVFGELVINWEPDVVATSCPDTKTWVDIVRCQGLKTYSGSARFSSGIIVFGVFVICITFASAGFVSRHTSMITEPPWQRNHIWVGASALILGFTALIVDSSMERKVTPYLPWYFYVLTSLMPFFSLMWVDMCKKPEEKLARRSEKLRRLQFETRLGAWSPK